MEALASFGYSPALLMLGEGYSRYCGKHFPVAGVIMKRLRVDLIRPLQIIYRSRRSNYIPAIVSTVSAAPAAPADRARRPRPPRASPASPRAARARLARRRASRLPFLIRKSEVRHSLNVILRKGHDHVSTLGVQLRLETAPPPPPLSAVKR
ncbi:hypothetical protein EVAR_53266_1 [Eumeta japonica]|uniref:Uncharacterized protein n=1 Tax=Eumeta variegata TaxID=151549 RepID=A0A4C1YKD5_EUMVA|nr:hypothetical protein EVAR_53266_1 [Eumeta japonica]